MNHPQSSRLENVRKLAEALILKANCLFWIITLRYFLPYCFYLWSPAFQRNNRTSCYCRRSFNLFLYTCFGLLLSSLRAPNHTQQGFSIKVDSHHWAAATTGWDHKCLMVLNLKVSLSFSNTSWQSQNHTKDPAFNAGTCHQAWSMNLINRQ